MHRHFCRTLHFARFKEVLDTSTEKKDKLLNCNSNKILCSCIALSAPLGQNLCLASPCCRSWDCELRYFPTSPAAPFLLDSSFPANSGAPWQSMLLRFSDYSAGFLQPHFACSHPGTHDPKTNPDGTAKLACLRLLSLVRPGVCLPLSADPSFGPLEITKTFILNVIQCKHFVQLVIWVPWQLSVETTQCFQIAEKHSKRLGREIHLCRTTLKILLIQKMMWE